MRLIRCAPAAAAILVTACAGMYSDDYLAAQDHDALCQGYYIGTGKERLRAELERRGEISPEEWSAIETREIYLGMGAPAVVCAIGRPERVNTTTRAGAVSEQWVYGDLLRGTSYVYIRDGRVDSIQTSR